MRRFVNQLALLLVGVLLGVMLHSLLPPPVWEPKPYVLKPAGEPWTGNEPVIIEGPNRTKTYYFKGPSPGPGMGPVSEHLKEKTPTDIPPQAIRVLERPHPTPK